MAETKKGVDCRTHSPGIRYKLMHISMIKPIHSNSRVLTPLNFSLNRRTGPRNKNNICGVKTQNGLFGPIASVPSICESIPIFLKSGELIPKIKELIGEGNKVIEPP